MSNERPRIAITGANGFIGRHLQSALRERHITYRALIRRRDAVGPTEDIRFIDDIGPRTEWGAVLDGIEVVVHLAARTHVLDETAKDPRAEFMRVNADGTARLASAAASAGVKRLVYLSSVKVLGNASGAAPFTSASIPCPHDAYGESKLAGENAARSIATGRLQVVVVRPPLVYGPAVRANFLRLLRWIDRELPLPLGAVRNRRSLVNVWNLCDLLLRLLDRPEADKHCWLVSDGQDVSTAELIRRIAFVMGRRARLLPVPAGLLQYAGRVLGRASEVTQLCGSLAVDISDMVRELEWHPPVSLEEGLTRTVSWFHSTGT